MHEFAEYLPNGQQKVTYEGSAGKPKTPVFHKFGNAYWSGMGYYFLVNLNNPKITTKLFQEETETKEKFNERAQQAISKFALEPEILEPIIREVEMPSGEIVRTIRKRQTIAEIQEEKEKKEAEEAEEI